MLTFAQPSQPFTTPYATTIVENESLISLLGRASAALGYPKTTSLLGILKLTERQVLEGTVDTSAIARFLRVPDAKVEPVARLLSPLSGLWRFKGVEAQEHYLDREDMRICPCCIRETPVHMQQWSLRPFPVCVTHKTRLISRCLECKKPLRWSYIPRYICECGYHLAQTKTASAAPAEIRVAEFFLGRIFSESAGRDILPTPFEGLDAIELFRIALCLGAVNFQHSRVKILEKPAMGSVEYAKMAAIGLERLLLWAKNFRDKLITSVPAWGELAVARRILEPFWRHIVAANSPALTQQVADILVPALDCAEYYSLAKSIELRGATIKSLSITEAETRKILGMSEAEFVSLRKGALWSGVRVLGHYGKSEIYFRSDIEALKQSWDEYETVAQLSARSGLSKPEVRELHGEGKLESTSGLATREREVFVKSNWLDDLEARLDVNLPMQGSRGWLKTFGQLKIMASRRDLDLGHIIDLLVAGTLRPLAKIKGVGLKRFLFSGSDAEVLFDDLHVKIYKRWPMRALLKRLEFTYNVLYAFEKCGVFGWTINDGAKGKFVTTKNLEAFERKYISCKALSKLLNVQPAVAREQVQALGIQPKHEADVYGHHFRLYLRTDIRSVRDGLGLTEKSLMP